MLRMFDLINFINLKWGLLFNSTYLHICHHAASNNILLGRYTHKTPHYSSSNQYHREYGRCHTRQHLVSAKTLNDTEASTSCIYFEILDLFELLSMQSHHHVIDTYFSNVQIFYSDIAIIAYTAKLQ